MSSPTSSPRAPRLRLLPDISEPTDGRASNRLVDVATLSACRSFGVPQWIAVAALRAAGRLSGRSVREVATGLLLAERLPPSLVERVQHFHPSEQPETVVARPDFRGRR